MAGMGVMSNALDKVLDRLPTWAKVVLGLVLVAGIVYGIVSEGWVFILKVIFSPEF
jgi:hypothetical protein